jgi:hypothetical protein
VQICFTKVKKHNCEESKGFGIREMKNYKSKHQEQTDGEISLCRKCYCMTKSIVSEDGTHYNCGKCGATK